MLSAYLSLKRRPELFAELPLLGPARLVEILLVLQYQTLTGSNSGSDIVKSTYEVKSCWLLSPEVDSISTSGLDFSRIP